MEKIIKLILILLIPLISTGQVERYDEIKMKVILDKQPLPGTSIIIENLENQDSFNTNFDGEVKIKIPNDKDRIRLSFLGPIYYTNKNFETCRFNCCESGRKKSLLFYGRKKNAKAENKTQWVLKKYAL